MSGGGSRGIKKGERLGLGGGEDVVRFDAAGFEVQVRVQGATEVKVAISQEINGPGGWYADVSDEINGETEFEDG